jgi:hypothetical protein
MGCRLLKMGRLTGVYASLGRKGVRKAGVTGGLQSTADRADRGRRKANAETLRMQRFAEVLGRRESSLQEAMSL